jgi:putative ABC transport system permease protein
MVFTLIGIALFILIMAVVNFVNISIGNSSSRLKEIGVRKVLGGLKTQLIRQFLVESVILSLVSMLFSIIFYLLFKPLFEDTLGKKIISIFNISTYFSILLFVFSILIGLLSGIYPALVLSKTSAIETLKGKLKSVKENLFFRRFLLITQFTTAIVILCASTFISKQVSYFFNKDLGYNKEAMLSFSLPRD